MGIACTHLRMSYQTTKKIANDLKLIGKTYETGTSIQSNRQSVTSGS